MLLKKKNSYIVFFCLHLYYTSFYQCSHPSPMLSSISSVFALVLHPTHSPPVLLLFTRMTFPVYAVVCIGSVQFSYSTAVWAKAPCVSAISVFLVDSHIFNASTCKLLKFNLHDDLDAPVSVKTVSRCHGIPTIYIATFCHAGVRFKTCLLPF